MYKYSLSVRAYNIARRYCGLPTCDTWKEHSPQEMQEALAAAGKWVLENRRGLKTAVELLRASGAGVWNIYLAAYDASPYNSLEYIGELCNLYDNRLHTPLD